MSWQQCILWVSFSSIFCKTLMEGKLIVCLTKIKSSLICPLSNIIVSPLWVCSLSSHVKSIDFSSSTSLGHPSCKAVKRVLGQCNILCSINKMVPNIYGKIHKCPYDALWLHVSQNPWFDMSSNPRFVGFIDIHFTKFKICWNSQKKG